MSPVVLYGRLEVTGENGRNYGGEGSVIPIDFVAVKGIPTSALLSFAELVSWDKTFNNNANGYIL